MREAPEDVQLAGDSRWQGAYCVERGGVCPLGVLRKLEAASELCRLLNGRGAPLRLFEEAGYVAKAGVLLEAATLHQSPGVGR